MATKPKKPAAPAAKKVPAKVPAKPNLSPVVLAAENAIKLNSAKISYAATVAVLDQLQIDAVGNVEVLKFLAAALRKVKKGGGSDGGTLSNEVLTDPPK